MNRLFVLAALFILPHAFAGSVSGSWAGAYHYENNRSAEVKFGLLLCQDGPKLKGDSVEPNTFGDKSAKFLKARLKGEAANGKIRFQKVYDGSGGVRHSVSYTGEVHGDRITGRWEIDQGNRGSFELSRNRAEVADELCDSKIQLEQPSDITGAQ